MSSLLTQMNQYQQDAHSITQETQAPSVDANSRYIESLELKIASLETDLSISQNKVIRAESLISSLSNLLNDFNKLSIQNIPYGSPNPFSTSTTQVPVQHTSSSYGISSVSSTAQVPVLHTSSSFDLLTGTSTTQVPVQSTTQVPVQSTTNTFSSMTSVNNTPQTHEYKQESVKTIQLDYFQKDNSILSQWRDNKWVDISESEGNLESLFDKGIHKTYYENDGSLVLGMTAVASPEYKGGKRIISMLSANLVIAIYRKADKYTKEYLHRQGITSPWSLYERMCLINGWGILTRY